MSTIEHAKQELKAAGLYDSDSDYGGMLAEAVMKLLEVHVEEGHSGASNSMVINLFSKLANQEPLGPLTGEDGEWGEPYDHEGTRQNKRCSHVFMNADGSAYDILGKVFREPNGSSYTSADSHVPVQFPYTPVTEYVDVAV